MIRSPARHPTNNRTTRRSLSRNLRASSWLQRRQCPGGRPCPFFLPGWDSSVPSTQVRLPAAFAARRDVHSVVTWLGYYCAFKPSPPSCCFRGAALEETGKMRPSTPMSPTCTLLGMFLAIWLATSAYEALLLFQVA